MQGGHVYRCLGGLTPLLDEMLVEEGLMLLGRLEMMWGQGNRQNRNACFQTDLHQSADNRLRHEIMPVNAAINDQRCTYNSIIPARLSQPLCKERHLERTRHIIAVDRNVFVEFAQALLKSGMRLINDLGVPSCPDKRDFLGILSLL